MRRLLPFVAAVAALCPAIASAADYAPPHRVQRHYAPRYAQPMPVYREVPLPVIAPPKPLYYVPSPVYYVQHLDQGCGPCGSYAAPAPGRWYRHQQWPF